MTVTCAVIDDDPLAINILKNYLSKIADVEFLGSAEDALNGVEFVNSLSPNILFLDVEMPELSGLEFLKLLDNPPMVIITSAKKKYAVDGFDLNIFDYIVKPITIPRLIKSINKYKDKQRENKNASIQEYIFVNENKKRVKIKISEILFVESLKDYIKINSLNKTVVIKEQISSFFKILPPSLFIRVHRSYLVAINHIESYSPTSIEINGNDIPIGRSYKNNCISVLDNL